MPSAGLWTGRWPATRLSPGWVGWLKPDLLGRRRRFRAWVFTPVVSRYRFVYVVFRETTETAIEACEAAWRFYGGVFDVVVPDNAKCLVQTADPLEPTINRGFLEYAQARGFVIDTARAGRATDKPRVERTVRVVAEDCFGGETLLDIESASQHALWWCREDNGMRRHGTTQRMPKGHFECEELPRLLEHHDAGPESPEGLGELATDRPRPDHGETGRSLGQREDRLVVEISALRQARDGRRHRPRTRGDHRLPEPEVDSVDVDPIPAGEARLAQVDVDPELLAVAGGGVLVTDSRADLAQPLHRGAEIRELALGQMQAQGAGARKYETASFFGMK